MDQTQGQLGSLNTTTITITWITPRDNWVEIKRENVMVGQEYNFNQLTSEEVTMIMVKIMSMIIMIMITVCQ